MPLQPGVGPFCTRSLALALALLASALAGPLLAQVHDAAPEPRFLAGARVEVLSDELGQAWVTGQVGKVGKCLVIHVPEASEGPDQATGLALMAVDSLRVSSVYDGLDDPERGHRAYSEGASLEGERWIPVPTKALEAAARDASACLNANFPPGRVAPGEGTT